VNVLAISDKVQDLLYSPAIRQRFAHIDAVISCGDLPFYYLEYIISMLDVPLYFVHGNHQGTVEHTTWGSRTQAAGAINLDGRTERLNGILLAGFEGCLRYNSGPHQYQDYEMWTKVFGMAPRLLLNKARHGRYLDVLVTHAPPRHIHDQPDRAHQGFQAFPWFLRTFQPRWHLHGHIHVYSNQTVTQTQYYQTQVLNVYGHREMQLEVPSSASQSSVREERETKQYGMGTTDSGRF
jgi:Icc-related predicted phosphoesterase